MNSPKFHNFPNPEKSKKLGKMGHIFPQTIFNNSNEISFREGKKFLKNHGISVRKIEPWYIMELSSLDYTLN